MIKYPMQHTLYRTARASWPKRSGCVARNGYICQGIQSGTVWHTRVHHIVLYTHHTHTTTTNSALPDAPPRIRARFVECFTDNITCVIGSISVATGESTDYRMHLCTVLKAYMFIASMLLHCSLSHMEQDVASTSAAPKRGGGRKGGAGKHMTGPNAAEHARSWLAASERVLCAVEQLANCNLVAMYSPAHVAKDLVNCWSTMVCGFVSVLLLYIYYVHCI